MSRTGLTSEEQVLPTVLYKSKRDPSTPKADAFSAQDDWGVGMLYVEHQKINSCYLDSIKNKKDPSTTEPDAFSAQDD